jgi:hypothetical protein
MIDAEKAAVKFISYTSADRDQEWLIAAQLFVSEPEA